MGNSNSGTVLNSETRIFTSEEEKNTVSVCMYCHSDNGHELKNIGGALKMMTALGQQVHEFKGFIREFMVSVDNNISDSSIFTWSTWNKQEADINSNISTTTPVFDAFVMLDCPSTDMGTDDFKSMCGLLKVYGILIVSGNVPESLTCENGHTIVPLFSVSKNKKLPNMTIMQKM